MRCISIGRSHCQANAGTRRCRTCAAAAHRSTAVRLRRPPPLSVRSLPLGRHGIDPDESIDEDPALMAELAARKAQFHPSRSQRGILEMGWRLRMKDQEPKTCKECHGQKKLECPFCHGTCVMQLGDTVYCSDTGCQSCPACQGEGYVECRACQGIGYKAWWLSSTEDTPA